VRTLLNKTKKAFIDNWYLEALSSIIITVLRHLYIGVHVYYHLMQSG
jgi:hypothetical protein